MAIRKKKAAKKIAAKNKPDLPAIFYNAQEDMLEVYLSDLDGVAEWRSKNVTVFKSRGRRSQVTGIFVEKVSRIIVDAVAQRAKRIEKGRRGQPEIVITAAKFGPVPLKRRKGSSRWYGGTD